VKINPSVVCEQVGDDVVVLDSENSAVLTLTGDSAAVVRRLLAGETVSDTEPGLQELLAQGVLVSESSKGLSRRSLVMSGMAVGAGGVLALSLPAAANASSSSLLTPIFAVSLDPDDGSYWESTNEDTVVEFIKIEKVDFVNDDRFPDGFTLEWSFFSSFADPEEFETRGDPINRYVWDREGSGLTIPAGSLDVDDNLPIFVRVRFGSLLSPVVQIVIPLD
jgi:hypothetical protein